MKMESIFDAIRVIFITSLAALAAYLDPVSGALQSILGLLLINFIVGLFTGLIVEDESFSFKKFKAAVCEGAFFLGLISFTFYLGERNGNATETLYCVSAITYIIIYCYSVNVLKNVRMWLTKGSPSFSAVDMIYYILTIEFVKKFPAFDKFKQTENK